MSRTADITRIFWHRVGSSNAARSTPIQHEGCASKHEASAGTLAGACFVAVMLVYAIAYVVWEAVR